MNLNTNHFTMTPTVDMPRSSFKTPKNIRTTFNVGQLIPIWVNQDIYPGDTIRLNNISMVIRAATPIHPTMDNAYADVFVFAVPKRICWEHFREMMGENRTGIWAPSIEYTEKQIKFVKTSSDSTSFTIKKGDLAHYMGLPLFNPTLGGGETSRTIEVSALPFISYIKIWNEYFRCQSIEAPAFEPYDDSTITTISDANIGNSTYDGWHILNINSQTEIQRKPAPVNRFPDWYSTSTPQPQRGNAIKTPLGTTAPVAGTGIALGLTNGTVDAGLSTYSGNELRVFKEDLEKAVGTVNGTTSTGWTNASAIGVTTDTSKSGLYADLANALAPTVNALRLSIATQRILERDVYGARFREIIKNHFHIRNTNDARMQIPEFLFSFRQPLNIEQVPQTSSTDATTPQGNLAGYSHTVSVERGFVKSFVEWSTIMALICVRCDHSYSQGIEKQWCRKRRLDYYWPALSHIGEQPILTKYIYADGSSNDDTVFGYQEAWSEMKYERNLNTGAFDPMYAQTLASWHYGDAYSSAPVLSPEWMNETAGYFDRTIAVTSELEDQIIADIHLDITRTSCQPIYSTPGLMDHY